MSVSEYAAYQHMLHGLRVQAEGAVWEARQLQHQNEVLRAQLEHQRDREQRLRAVLLWPHQVKDLLVDQVGMAWEEAEALLESLEAEEAAA